MSKDVRIFGIDLHSIHREYDPSSADSLDGKSSIFMILSAKNLERVLTSEGVEMTEEVMREQVSRC